MAGENMKYLDELLVAWPDNTQGLVNPVDGRDGWLASAPALGVQSDPLGELLIPAGTNVDVNLALSPSFLGGQGVTQDGNGALVMSYGPITVPAGYTRIVQAQAQFTFESSTNETTTFYFDESGAPNTDTEQDIAWNAQSVAIPISIFGWFGLDVSVNNPVTLRFDKATGTAAITNFQMSIIGYLSGDSDSAGANFFNGTDRGFPTP